MVSARSAFHVTEGPYSPAHLRSQGNFLRTPPCTLSPTSRLASVASSFLHAFFPERACASLQSAEGRHGRDQSVSLLPWEQLRRVAGGVWLTNETLVNCCSGGWSLGGCPPGTHDSVTPSVFGGVRLRRGIISEGW